MSYVPFSSKALSYYRFRLEFSILSVC
uniref:Uncharacterized protein n=1 Tax=Moniliophthora roreri TaxID=221103 RepID=A0A0W0FBK2_MONRR